MTRGWPLCVLAAFAAGCGSSSSDTAALASPPAPAVGSTANASAPLERTSTAHATGDLPKVTGQPSENAILRLQVTEAGFFPPDLPAQPGRRPYTVTLRGLSKSDSGALLGGSRGDDVLIDARRFIFAQDERGCVSQPESGVTGVPNLFGDTITFSPAKHVEGRLTFLVPHDAQRIRVLIAPAGSDGLAVPAGAEFTPAWPAPVHTIDDGTTLQVLVLPNPSLPPGVPRPAAGREYVVLDVVVRNLGRDHGVEFQPSQQLRLMDPRGKFVQASAVTQQLGCRMDDGAVIPPGHSRRVMAIYEMPAGVARRLHYRGFEKEEAVVAIR
jgi:hypothetical protein